MSMDYPGDYMEYGYVSSCCGAGIMDKKSYLEEYGVDALDIWEEFNGEDPDEYRKKSYFGQSLEEQSDYEIQTEHWNKERA